MTTCIYIYRLDTVTSMATFSNEAVKRTGKFVFGGVVCCFMSTIGSRCGKHRAADGQGTLLDACFIV